MAEQVTILGMTFEQGEVLTSAKMNQLASKVDTIIQGINTEAERARAAEQAIQTTLQQMQTALNNAISTERQRAMAAEALIGGNTTSIDENGRITIGGTVYQLTRADEVFYHGEYSDSLNDLKGRASTGLWLIVPPQVHVSFTVPIFYLLVVCDTAGNTFQYRFSGSATPTSLAYANGVVGAFVQTRWHKQSSDTWSDWATISGEVFEKQQLAMVAFNDNFKMQAAIFEGMNVNYELVTGQTNNPWEEGVIDDGDTLRLPDGQRVLRYGGIQRETE